MTSNLIEKFEKYWKHVNGILAMATLLDPRYKNEID